MSKAIKEVEESEVSNELMEDKVSAYKKELLLPEVIQQIQSTASLRETFFFGRLHSVSDSIFFFFFPASNQIENFEREIDDAIALLNQYKKSLEEDIQKRDKLVNLLNETIKKQNETIKKSEQQIQVNECRGKKKPKANSLTNLPSSPPQKKRNACNTQPSLLI